MQDRLGRVSEDDTGQAGTGSSFKVYHTLPIANLRFISTLCYRFYVNVHGSIKKHDDPYAKEKPS